MKFNRWRRLLVRITEMSVKPAQFEKSVHDYIWDQSDAWGNIFSNPPWKPFFENVQQ